MFSIRSEIILKSSPVQKSDRIDITSGRILSYVSLYKATWYQQSWRTAKNIFQSTSHIIRARAFSQCPVRTIHIIQRGYQIHQSDYDAILLQALEASTSEETICKSNHMTESFENQLAACTTSWGKLCNLRNTLPLDSGQQPVTLWVAACELYLHVKWTQYLAYPTFFPCIPSSFIPFLHSLDGCKICCPVSCQMDYHRGAWNPAGCVWDGSRQTRPTRQCRPVIRLII